MTVPVPPPSDPVKHLKRPPSPCWRCGAPGVRDLGTRGYCTSHLIDLYETFSIVLTNPWDVLPPGMEYPE